MKKKKLYDIHCHAMNLSHPYFLAFIRRYNLSFLLTLNSVFGPISSLFIGKQMNKIQNLLSVMENDVGSIFVLMENCIKECKPSIVKNGKIIIGGNEYSKIVLTPLLIDFGYKGMSSDNIHYNEPAKKPIVEQVVDVFNGIRYYVNDYKSSDKLFEIYPFLGMNTQNYFLGKETSEKISCKPELQLLSDSLRKKVIFRAGPKKLVFRGEMSITEKEEFQKLFNKREDIKAVEYMYKNSQDIKKRNTIPKMLDKYFKDYKRDSNDLLANMGKFEGDIESLASNFFAGIKVYPSLGFDPWPEGDKEELRKVKYLYRYCCKKSIPITAHCNDTGYAILDKDRLESYTSPFKWEKVLKRYPKLKLNLAHMGKQQKFLNIFPVQTWAKKAIQLVLDYDNVFVDFACRGDEDKFYKYLKELISQCTKAHREKLERRILFGSDFSINLMWCNSYSDYFNCFSGTPYFDRTEKDLFCSINPETFLFG